MSETTLPQANYTSIQSKNQILLYIEQCKLTHIGSSYSYPLCDPLPAAPHRHIHLPEYLGLFIDERRFSSLELKDRSSLKTKTNNPKLV